MGTIWEQMLYLRHNKIIQPMKATAFIRKTASKNDTNSLATIYFRLRDGKKDIKDDILRVENDPNDENRLNLTINRKPIADWFREQWHKLRYGIREPQQKERQGRGMKL